MTSIYILSGMYGIGVMFILGFLASIIQKRDLLETAKISNLMLGFIIGGVGRLLCDKLLEEIYPISPIIAWLAIACFISGTLGMVISSVFIRHDALNTVKETEEGK